jgi:ubiquinone/menaquinone biosynthesis C-methylase UbiE
MTTPSEPRTTHFGYQTVAEGEKAERVRAVFASVARRYDVMNDLMSLGLHRLWKRFAVELSGVRAGDRVLDVAGGSGDLTRLFRERVGPRGEVLLTDINHDMLQVGRDRLIDVGMPVPVIQCDAERLPFAERRFDCLVDAFLSLEINRKNFLNSHYVLRQLLKRQGVRVAEDDLSSLKIEYISGDYPLCLPLHHAQ